MRLRMAARSVRGLLIAIAARHSTAWVWRESILSPEEGS
ncbi:hypothetical protein SAMN05216330_108200 [Bradyrhizobium sp. Ghvi]|nr:hypothetical protein SAMN05216330_108200 [Bradyrhizobium sp. Ghvi]